MEKSKGRDWKRCREEDKQRDRNDWTEAMNLELVHLIMYNPSQVGIHQLSFFSSLLFSVLSLPLVSESVRVVMEVSLSCTLALLSEQVWSLFIQSSQFPSYLFHSAIMSSLAVGIFFFYSHRADNRFIKGIVGTYEVSPPPSPPLSLRSSSHYSPSATSRYSFLPSIGSLLLLFLFIHRLDARSLFQFPGRSKILTHIIPLFPSKGRQRSFNGELFDQSFFSYQHDKRRSFNGIRRSSICSSSNEHSQTELL